MTQAETTLWSALRRNNLGYRFRRQYPIPPFIVDFACIEARLIVEADGSQHAAPREDDHRDAFLRQHGWRVLRFWNNDILGNIEGVITVVLEALGSERGSPLPNPPPQAGEGEIRAGERTQEAAEGRS